jgi:hypothetical protein
MSTEYRKPHGGLSIVGDTSYGPMPAQGEPWMASPQTQPKPGLVPSRKPEWYPNEDPKEPKVAPAAPPSGPPPNGPKGPKKPNKDYFENDKNKDYFKKPRKPYDENWSN